MTKKPKKDLPRDEADETVGDRWLYNGIVFFFVLPLTLYLGWMSRSIFGYMVFPGFGGALAIWRVAVTPEIHNRITINLNLKGRKQVVKDSPGASLTQADTIYQNFGIPKETDQVPPNLVAAYTAMRKVVRGWQDPRWSNFYEWTQLDENDPHSVIQIKRTAPDLADLCDKAVSMFGEIRTLRTEVNGLIDDEQEKLVQEFQPKFDSGSKVKFSFFRISANGGNDDQLYLAHAWMKRQNVMEHAEFRAHERIPNLKTWKLELVVTGQRMLAPLTQTVAVDEEAINFGQKVLDYLQTREAAHKLRETLLGVQELRAELLPLIERELSKG